VLYQKILLYTLLSFLLSYVLVTTDPPKAIPKERSRAHNCEKYLLA